MGKANALPIGRDTHRRLGDIAVLLIDIYPLPRKRIDNAVGVRASSREADCEDERSCNKRFLEMHEILPHEAYA